jgi:hypothetical protein
MPDYGGNNLISPSSEPGYSWLENVSKSLDMSRLVPTSPTGVKWKTESARLFLKYLGKMVDTIRSRGRSVWFMARPLESRKFLSGSDGKVSFSHWGILISDFAKPQLEERIAEFNASPEQVWGDLHELRNHFGTARYECSDYVARDYARATKLNYLGQTEVTNDELYSFGISHCLSLIARPRIDSIESKVRSFQE